MKKTTLLKSMLLIVGSGSVWADPTTLYLETFGSTASNTAVSSYSGFSATTSMFTTSGTVKSHYSGSGSVGKNNLSAANLSHGYTGASGLSGCYHVGTADTEATIIQISNINIEGYSNLSLSFGAFGGSATHKVNVSYIIDSGLETALISNGSITNANWTLLSQSIGATGKSLTLIFKHTPSKAWTIRLDDIKVTGITSLASSATTFTTKTPEITYPATKTYSQVPTTADGYDGEITYSLTENTAGATINSETGLVTVTKGGTVTVKATAAAVAEKFTSSEDTYTLTVNDTRASAGLAWSAASADVTYGDDGNVFPTLTNPHDVSVTYSSSNTSAATIDESGVITLKDKTASTTISAIFAGNETYKDQTVTYTLNVTEGPFVFQDGVFNFVKAASAEPFEDYGSGMTLVSSGYTTTNKTWTAGNVTMVTSRVSGNGYRWWSTDGTLRFYDGSKATFSVPSGYVITKIVTTGANFDGADVGTLSGATWTGASNEVALSVTATHNIKTITVTYTTENQTITPAKTYTTLTSSYNLDFTSVSSDLKAYIATEVSGGAVQMTQVNKVPAGTGLVLKATTPGTAVNVPVFDGTSPDDVSANKMAGSATNTTAIAANGGYILKEGVFQPATAGTLAAGKAYLNIAVISSAHPLEMNFEEGDVTGISEIEKMRDGENETFFNLAGQRVAQPTKGLYIVNGKKVVLK